MTTLLGFGQSLTPQSWIESSYSTASSNRTSIASVLAAAGAVLPVVRQERIHTKKYLGRGATFHVEVAEIDDFDGGILKPRAVTVAIKRFRKEVFQSDFARACAKREIQLLTHPKLRQHPNIMNLWGYGWDSSMAKASGDSSDPLKGAVPYLLADLANYGSLRDFLLDQKFTEKISEGGLKDLAMLLVDTAQGILALHENRIIHGDVKLDNALVFAMEPNKEGIKFRAKLADFGACILESECAYRQYLGTERYNPMLYFDSEVGENVDIIQQYYKTDVYSFGFLIWETFLNGGFYAEGEDMVDSIREAFEVQGSIETIASSFLNELQEKKRIPEEYVEKTRAVILPCLEKKYWKRKDMKQVVDMLFNLEDTAKKYSGAEDPSTISEVDIMKLNISSTTSAKDREPDSEPAMYRNPVEHPRMSHNSILSLTHQNINRTVYNLRWTPGKDPLQSEESEPSVSASSEFFCISNIQAVVPGSAMEKYSDFDFFTSQESVAWEIQTIIFEELLKDAESDDTAVAGRAKLHLAYCYEIGFGTDPAPKKFLPALQKAADDDWVAEGLLANITTAEENSASHATKGSSEGIWKRLRDSQKAIVQHESTLPISCQGKSFKIKDRSAIFELVREYKPLPSYEEQNLHSPIFIKVKLSDDVEETRSLVQHAARLGEFNIIRYNVSWLSFRPALKPNFDDYTPASVYAMEFGHKRVADFLLKFNNYECDSRGVTPLHWIFMFDEDDAKELARLIAYGKESVYQDRRFRLDARPGYNAHGIRLERIEPVKFEEFGLQLFGAPLHWAVRVGCLHAVKVLLDLGANVDLEYGDTGVRPLDIAVAFHYPDITKLLLERNAKYVNSKGLTPLHQIMRVPGNTSIARHVIHGDRQAIRQAFKDTLRVLLDANLDLNTENKDGRTPLVDFTTRGVVDADIYILEELTVAGANWFTSNSSDTTRPLIEACVGIEQFRKNLQLVEFILSSFPAVDINALGAHGMAAIHHCAIFNSSAAITTLAESKPGVLDINLRSVKEPKLPAIELAAMFGQTEAFQKLYELGADPTGPEYNVLKTALYYRHMGIVEFLIEEGMDLKIERPPAPGEVIEAGKYHETVLHAACASNYTSSSLVKTLFDKYPKLMKPLIDVQDSEWETPLYRAAHYSDLEAVETLLSYGASPHIKAGHNMRPVDIANEILKNGPNLRLHKNRVATEQLRKEFMGNMGEIQVLLEQAMEE